MKLPDNTYTQRPWRIHEMTTDFRLEDVWALPVAGGRDDFPRLVELMATSDPEQFSSRIVRTLFAIRWKVGGLLGWDDEKSAPGAGTPSLRDRLPADLRDSTSVPDIESLPFRPPYMTVDEWALEIANSTMHGVMHLGWVEDGDGGYRGEMAVLVKPNGLFGELYMAAIDPVRRLVVYPPMLRELGRRWQGLTPPPAAPPPAAPPPAGRRPGRPAAA